MPHGAIEIFLWLLGLAVGSFLNVVIFRLPAGLSIADPPRSFCPACRAGIAWYDNLPLLSWLILRGRCRHCGAAISVQYPLVEGLTGLAFVLVYHLLFVAQARAGLTAELPGDVPLLLSWLVLAAGLIACSAMDIATYNVDVRITNVVIGAGVIAAALWPRGEFLAPRAETAFSAAGAAAFIVSILITLIWNRWTATEDEASVATDGPAGTDAQTPPS
ncbi:MAG: prepilin peptidase, partial [Planctomycetota bacterium]